ncbi:hypothetical protein P168DRAFT_316194 [Aspergillus campestris IBT 28561]|uniref:Uncharacterized protein n=1 Tax=Aspergillus campestris (strain IBT 28561) TaxID=1392248 RepID=A0A2I1D8H6_ASPC2|nr:uncharacterized protein P168DRAFT_316194 [Aspergillus campestris IBT 28561]PKY06174.1 hypothetical protein P168DRAFT_316194 [Aspergillus campestris IBT 28561]
MTSKTPVAFRGGEAPKHLNQFWADLETSINYATKFNPYRKTAVIAFHWENDDMEVEKLERELLGVFHSSYGFETESFLIPVQFSLPSLTEHLIAWSRRNSGDDTLRVLVYSGHASSAGTVAPYWNLGGRCDRNTGSLQGPQFNWWGVRETLEVYPGDSCYIFDCCSAASGALNAYNGAEFMAACAWEQTATSNLNFCFTRVLIDELRQLDGRPETLASIYARIFRYAQQNQVAATPVHIPKRNSPSVTIGRNHSRPPITRKSEQNTYNVLLSVKVREEIPLDPTQWKQWLTRNIPPNVQSANITIEGAFQGSSLLLFSVPVEVWTMLPANDSSYTFVGHVKSHIIVPQPVAHTTTLPTHHAVPPARENQRPRSPDRKAFGSPGSAPFR